MPRKKRFLVSSPKACIFCNLEEDNEFLYGNFLHEGTLSVHQHCMFFASGLKQNGKKDTDGLSRFLIPDIEREKLRGRKLRCHYCKIAGATIGCCNTTCRRSFHYPCGLKHKSLHQFFDNFSSYCPDHKPVQRAIKTSRDRFYCHICFIALSRKDVENCLYAPCCKKNWFHRSCLQQYASSAGRHFFKCPLCNNSSDFIKEMETYGICVPEKDASWELEENAYEDLLHRPECGATTCHCRSGRKYDGESLWDLLPCSVCGSHARHKYCENLKVTDESWKCSECQCLEDQIQKSKHRTQDMSVKEELLDEVADCQQSHQASESSVPSCSSVTSTPSNSDLKKTVVDIHSPVDVKLEVTDTFILPDTRKPGGEDISAISIEGRESVKRKVLGEPNTTTKKIATTEEISIKNKIDTSQNFLTSFLVSKSVKTNVAPAYQNSKLNSKKRKKGGKNDPGCCSGHPHQCIRKMFGLECQQYRNRI